VPEAQMKLISEGLQKSPEHDLRSQFQEPLFRRSITSLENIHAGAVLTGDIFISYLSKKEISVKVNKCKYYGR
jgi:transcriptional accessory protein Tex/SPT6